MHHVFIIGAGQLGSRHLQALQLVGLPLMISVIDPFKKSLEIAKERYEQIKGKNHSIEYLTEIPKNRQVDLAIIATNSDVRAKVIKELVNHNQVKYLILEKLLFEKKQDYSEIEKLLNRKKIKTWVDCSMRTMPEYYKLKKKIFKPICYFVTGSQYGLITNAIHYIDHMAYLIDSYDYKVDTSGLLPKVFPSKRKGYLEVMGTLSVVFKDGSTGMFTSFVDGSAPVQIGVYSGRHRCVFRQFQGRVWVSDEKEQWKWKDMEAKVPFQSEMTNLVVEDIFKKGNCDLPDLKTSVKLHLPLLDSLKKFVNQNSKKKYNYYPFT